ncbi:hypothetical protein B566_EDAN013662 [Ephemera danica]|nr:hypothetical protein B566_EDAN013662 [Ephemera danica]
MRFKCENFAVFRGESGEVHVLDAYCPHLGANMAVGGTVRGDTLECESGEVHVLDAYCPHLGANMAVGGTEIPENGADVAHLNAIHGPALTSGGDLRSAGSLLAGGTWARHVWHASWQALTTPGQTHRATMQLQHELRLFNKIPLMSMNVKAHQIGPGYVELAMETSFGQAVFLQTVTPVAPLLQRVTHRLYTTPYMPAIFSNIMILGEAIMVRSATV